MLHKHQNNTLDLTSTSIVSTLFIAIRAHARGKGTSPYRHSNLCAQR